LASVASQRVMVARQRFAMVHEADGRRLGGLEGAEGKFWDPILEQARRRAKRSLSRASTRPWRFPKSSATSCTRTRLCQVKQSAGLFRLVAWGAGIKPHVYRARREFAAWTEGRGTGDECNVHVRRATRRDWVKGQTCACVGCCHAHLEGKPPGEPSSRSFQKQPGHRTTSCLAHLTTTL
jgi:hypothetical protein